MRLSLTDMVAGEFGLDPAEVRRKNFIAKESFPATTGSKDKSTAESRRVLRKLCTRKSSTMKTVN